MNQENRRTGPNKEALSRRRNYLLLALVGLLVLFWISSLYDFDRIEISYTRFKQEVGEGNISEVIIETDRIEGEIPSDRNTTEGGTRFSQPFYTVIPSIEDPELMPLLEKNGVKIVARSAKGDTWTQVLIFMLPWILIIGLIIYSARKMQQGMPGGAGQGGPFGFGRSRARRFRKGSSDVSFRQVAGLENAKKDLEEIIGYLREPDRYKTLGAKIPKGVLLMGPPGTGKTLLARAVAGEADVPFYSISGSEFIEMFVGVGAARVRDMFESARKEAPAIIFIDEIDSVGRARGTGLGGGHDEREQTLNQILSQMDGFLPHETVVVVAATNRPDVLDPALLRPGRFDRKVALELPQRKARREILEVHTRKTPLAGDVDLEALAARTAGFSGADLENLVNEASLLAAREKKEKVDMAALAAARDKVILGTEREDILKDEEKKRIAYHEAGHALLAFSLEHTDPLDKVTIIPRGRSLGVTHQIPEERYTLQRSYLLERITVMLGGRTSEKLIFGEVSTGAENDLEQATRLSRQMVCRWGMSEKLGPVSFRQGEEHIFLGREMTQPRDFSDHTAWLIDEEVRDLILAMEEKAQRILKGRQKALDSLAMALLEGETLQADEVKKVVEAAEDKGRLNQ